MGIYDKKLLEALAELDAELKKGHRGPDPERQEMRKQLLNDLRIKLQSLRSAFSTYAERYPKAHIGLCILFGVEGEAGEMSFGDQKYMSDLAATIKVSGRKSGLDAIVDGYTNPSEDIVNDKDNIVVTDGDE